MRKSNPVDGEGRLASNSRLLALWWLDGDEFIGPVDTLDGQDVMEVGRMLQIKFDHFQVWPLYAPEGMRGEEYDILPRGRVMFDTHISKFIVIGPASLVDEPGFQMAIREEYGLPVTTVFESDEHYG